MVRRLMILLLCLPSWVLPPGLALCLCTGELFSKGAGQVAMSCGCENAERPTCCSAAAEQTEDSLVAPPCGDCCVPILSTSGHVDAGQLPTIGNLAEVVGTEPVLILAWSRSCGDQSFGRAPRRERAFGPTTAVPAAPLPLRI